MITPSSECFYVVQADGEAAEFVAATLSLSTISDIEQAVLISKDFTGDIEASNSLDEAVDLVRQHLLSDVTEKVEHNPLYIPSTVGKIEEILEDDMSSENFRFVAMDGSPFTLKLVDISSEDTSLIRGKVACKPFDMPSYADIMRGFENQKLN